ncbi:MAG: tyrosine recombinase [Dehalococcoidia bacterium]|jgi:integrase/recombinase XerD|nr:tyrosine recombinase [Chloroflexota bacterium]RZP14121.1 MAG: tyrosine recombinase [Chloroflexota bacterium]|tara:strand:- start:3761 stop:4654 length:894 start_codon:yes stop_codon:yes gene_type:complete
MSLDDHLEKFYNYISSEKGYSLNTLESYSNDLKLLSNFLEDKNKKDWGNISIKDINEYFGNLKNQTKSTQKRKYASIKSFFKFLEKDNQIKSNILEKIRTPKVGSPIPKPLSIKEIEKIIEFKDSDQEEFTNTCVFILMYAAGLRVTEVISIKMGEIDLDNQTVKVTGKGNKQRVLPIYSNACKSLEHYINKVRPDLSKNKSYSSLLFVRKNLKQITRQYIWKKLKQRVLKVGINKNVTPHMIRHSFATHLLQGGASIRHVQEFLGHTSVESTQIYTKIPNEKLIQDYNVAHPRGNK